MANRLTMKEKTLLIHSEIIKEYPDILIILEQNKNITDELVEKLSDKQKNFFNNLLPHVVKGAIDEWKSDSSQIKDMGTDPSNWLQCSLDNHPTRYIFFIVNKLNQTTLNVGSECIKEFWYSWGEHFRGKNVIQLKQEATRLRLLNDLNDKIPGIIRIIDQWNSFIDNSEIILPSTLETPFKELGLKASGLYKEYLDEKVDISCTEQFKEFLSQRDQLVNEIKDYVSAKINEKYIPRKNIRSWLKNNNLSYVIEMLKADGEITWGTAHRIEEPSFMDLIISELNPKMKDLGLRIKSSDYNRRGYILETLKRERVQLFIRHSNLVKFCGWILFNEEPIQDFTMHNMLEYCSINNTNSLVSIVSDLGSIALRHHMEIDIENSRIDENELIINNKLTGEYYFTDYDGLAERFKELIIGGGSQTEEDFISYLQKIPGRRYTKERIEDLRTLRKEYNVEKF